MLPLRPKERTGRCIRQRRESEISVSTLAQPPLKNQNIEIVLHHNVTMRQQELSGLILSPDLPAVSIKEPYPPATYSHLRLRLLFSFLSLFLNFFSRFRFHFCWPTVMNSPADIEILCSVFRIWTNSVFTHSEEKVISPCGKKLFFRPLRYLLLN